MPIRALFINSDPPEERFRLGKVVELLRASRIETPIVWWVTNAAESAGGIANGMTEDQVRQYAPDLVIMDCSVGFERFPEGLQRSLEMAGTVFLYFEACPYSWDTEGFRRVGFPLAVDRRGTEEPLHPAYLARTPNVSTIELSHLEFAGGIFGVKPCRFQKLEARAAYILCPEEGGFLPLLTAPPFYDAKDPVWRHGHRYGSARKPYCFAGIRWRPNWAVLFACGMFNDQDIDRSENRKLLGAILTEIVEHRLGLDEWAAPGELEQIEFAEWCAILQWAGWFAE